MGKEAELIKAAKRGDLKFLERYLGQQNKRTSVIGSIRKPMHPNVQDELGYTLLHHSTLNGHTEVVSFLLSCGASTTIPDSSGSYPLHLASWKGDLEIVKLLITHGMSRPNVDQQSNSEDTALHLASQYGYSSVVEFLLERHANPMLKNIRGETPLDLASQFGHLDTVHVLISHCPELLTFSRQEISSLHLAARNGHTVVVLNLINAGISVNTMCTGGTALHEAAMCGKEDTVKLLLDKGVDPTLKDSRGDTVLNLLSQIPSQSAQRIHQLISQYSNKTRLPTERYMSPRKYRLLAVPIRDSDFTGDMTDGELPQLEYLKDESIVIQGRQSPNTYIGILHKVKGSFPISDMRIFQDINGKLHEVMKEDVIEFSDDGGIHVKQNSIRKDNEEKKEKAKSKRQHRMTDKEKKFVLSKDTGTYSQLMPVAAPATNAAEVKQISPPPSSASDIGGGRDYMGNYYLLEVGSMETTPPTSPETDSSIPSPPLYPAPQLRNDIPPPPIGAPPQPVIITRSSNALGDYENVEFKPKLPLKKRTKSFNVPQTESVLRPLEERPRSRTTRTSTYENVSPLLSPSNEGMNPSMSPEGGGEIEVPPVQMRKRHDSRDTQFQITESTESQEDVVISSLNPNYIKVELKNRPRPVESEEEGEGGVGRVSSPGGLVWFIPEENNPFAGLVQSSSVSDDSIGPPRGRLQSVWDDKRVSKEWTQINHFISSMNSTIQEYTSTEMATEATPTSNEPTMLARSPVSLWLSGMRLEGLSNVFEANGFDDMEFMGGDILTVADLQEMSIHADDQNIIAANMSRLRPPPSARHCTNVSEWLETLHLNTVLENTFTGYTLEKISQLWAMQLSTVLNIEELGYIKRLQYGIKELRTAHPEWYGSNTDTVIRLQEESNHPATSPALLQVNFTKDYRNIKSLKHQNGSRESLPSSLDNESQLKWVESGFNRSRTSHSTSALERRGTSDTPISVDRQLTGTSTSDTPTTENGTPTSGLDDTPIPVKNTPTSDLDVTSDTPIPVNNTPTSCLDDMPVQSTVNTPTVDQSASATPTTPLRYQTVPIIKGVSSSNATPTPVPVRGNDYATVRTDEGEGPVIHQERKRVHTATPPTEVHTYNTWYLGSSMVKGVVGKHSAEEACLKLRTQTDGIAKIPRIILSISWKGVKFIDAKSKMVVSNHLIRDISHCCPDIEDTRVFAYMTKEKETGRSYCHVFMAESKEAAEEIIMTVGQAFEVAYQAVIKARGHRSSKSVAVESAVDYSPTTKPSKKKSPVKKRSSFKSSIRKLNPRHKSSQLEKNSSDDIS